MDIFLRNKFLLRIVIVLVMVNLLSIGYLWFQRKDDRNGPPPRRDYREISKLLANELHFDKKQMDELEKIRNIFSDKEEVLGNVLREQRDSMNVEMFNENTDTILVKNIARRVADNEYQMELYRLKQAQQLKTICTPEQLKKFQDMVLDIRDYFQPQKNK